MEADNREAIAREWQTILTAVQAVQEVKKSENLYGSVISYIERESQFTVTDCLNEIRRLNGRS